MANTMMNLGNFHHREGRLEAAERSYITAQAYRDEILAKWPKPENSDGAPMQQLADVMVSPWFRYFLTYDPRPTLAKVTCPVLAIVGEKDCQVIPEQNLPEIEAALRTVGYAGG